MPAGITKPKSRFGKACDKLGVDVIAANSPQAKGRVERNHGVDQDRLVKELRLAGISTIEEANAFPRDTYLPKMNRKFSREPVQAEDAHVPLLDTDVTGLLCFEYERVVSNGEETGRYDTDTQGQPALKNQGNSTGKGGRKVEVPGCLM